MQGKGLALIFLAGIALTACAMKMPTLWSDSDSSRGEKATSVSGDRQNALPEGRAAASVPLPGLIATKPPGLDKVFAGRMVAVDSRIYDASVDRVFSAVIDAMTALNIPVKHVDSPGGTISTDWVFQNADSTTITLEAGKRVTIRYRFYVRVLPVQGTGIRLEIRTLAQQRIRDDWTPIRFKRKVSTELFDAVRDQLARLAPKKHDQGALIRP